MKKKVFPSTIKYRQNNPAISFRLKKEDKEKLDTIIKATGTPLSQRMTDFIHDKMDPDNKISELAVKLDTLKEYTREEYKEEKFNAPCSICGKPITFSSRQANWKTKIYPKLKETFKWYHVECKSS
jgi:predicted DNA-binding protein